MSINLALMEGALVHEAAFEGDLPALQRLISEDATLLEARTDELIPGP